MICRSRQYATRNAGYELRVRVGVTNTSTDSPIASGQQRSVIEPTANGVFTKRDSSIRPNTGCVVPKPSEEICLLQCAFNVEKGTPDQHSVFEPDTPTAQRGMDNEDRAS
ncbi:hypothetical protein CUC08_Gglean005653 [Alternaria sp. MG1]|jgi:hypothetical protein|nr:hypothetical protein CUC08_Gglean005653 [Alternaria sp. MG1]